MAALVPRPSAATADGGPKLPTPLQRPASSWELFTTFTLVSLQAFGGALAHIERAVVQKKRWLAADEFLGLFAISQALPGPTGISFCVLLGDRYFGLRGAAAALAGFILVPAVGVLTLAALFQHFQHLPGVQGALHGMGAASVALITVTAVRMSRSLRGQRLGMLVAVLTFGAVALLRWPVSTVMLTLGVASVAWAWRVLGPARSGAPP
jgi:chromate transporter